MPPRPPLDTIAILRRDDKNGKPYLWGRLNVSPPVGCRIHLTKLEDGTFALHVVAGWERKVDTNVRALAELFTDYAEECDAKSKQQPEG